MGIFSLLTSTGLSEAEIEAQLRRSWLALDDRARLERDLERIRRARPAPAPIPASAPVPAQPAIQHAPVQTQRPAPRPTPSGDSGRVQISRRDGGGYYVTCSIAKGKRFDGHFDTGADSCLISQKVARDHLGIRRLSHDSYAVLAGGRRVKAAITNVDWTVEGIAILSVRTMILHEDNDGTALVGMSFISRLKGVKIVGDSLLIYPPD
jgi:clan AA aspartic protease (TIGR02281 family)